MFFFFLLSPAKLTKLDHIHEEFYDGMLSKYPVLDDLGYRYDKEDPNVPVELFEKVLNSYTVFNESTFNTTDVASDCYFFLEQTYGHHIPYINSTEWTCSTYLDYLSPNTSTCTHQQSTVLADNAYHENRSKILITVSHKLHYASLGILCILSLYVSKHMWGVIVVFLSYT